ncbi:hypothetical protein QAD02_004694 [Eretmocerus hayati]|uniref:Uncharacterized protein n=1 Tax=Eretmocerus hayati TaxID=131215 RepID=A0ACC2NQN8_9HYME|nr:hypothetical protein QAD02_004694 [Eretmocerus hayati]
MIKKKENDSISSTLKPAKIHKFAKPTHYYETSLKSHAPMLIVKNLIAHPPKFTNISSKPMTPPLPTISTHTPISQPPEYRIVPANNAEIDHYRYHHGRIMYELENGLQPQAAGHYRSSRGQSLVGHSFTEKMLRLVGAYLILILVNLLLLSSLLTIARDSINYILSKLLFEARQFHPQTESSVFVL